ncbi:ATP synthase subunit C [Methylomonas rapida]|jgi:ATP synthase subunit C.|uniref:ATP synthase subunit C n=1 Tax=Methylomonas rapida TaxID=2963939 RepID=A0ABY7GGC4_9GAMM|nr:ATP synthase subunit C [Methylomonas rapida]WAR43195.1 ATP synthase subunit C [Methylomonas rapida]
MDSMILSLGWLGMYAPLALGAVGSMFGCARAGMAACGALVEVESGFGRFIAVAAMPSSQAIFGVVVTMVLRRDITLLNSPGIFGLGFLTGIALLLSGLAQGSACASAINASKSKLEIFGISLAPAALVEGFAVFAFVFALVLSASIPK